MENIPVYYGKVKPYDTTKAPIRQPLIFTWILGIGSKVLMLGKQYKIEKRNMDGLKPPYILLCSHNYFVDFYLQFIATFPHRTNTIATIDGYYRRPFLMEWLGCMCKRKFTTDVSMVRSIRKVLKDYGDILVMYPEARYSPIGTTAILPDSLAKLVKLNKVPVVCLVHHGNHLMTPFWNFRKPRKVPLHSTMTQVLTAEEVKEKSVEEIAAILRQAMDYDDYRYQKENNIRITEPHRAEGLHKVLYQCPHCLAESQMTSQGSRLTCTACGKSWELEEDGSLRALEGETEFSHVPDWFEWERSQVRRQIEDGTYRFEDDVEVYEDMDYEGEADTFANQQKNVKPLLPIEIFTATCGTQDIFLVLLYLAILIQVNIIITATIQITSCILGNATIIEHIQSKAESVPIVHMIDSTCMET